MKINAHKTYVQRGETMKVATIQMAVKDEESKQERLNRAEEMISALDEVDLILLPEMFTVGFFNFENYQAESEPLEGETVQRLAKKAKEKNAYLFTGSFVEEEEGKYYNACVLLDRQGEIVGHYRKMHLFGYGSKEREILSAGEKIEVVQTDFGKVGLSICYDLRFPEIYRKMVDQGAEVMINCAAWPYPRVENWVTLNMARAIENQAYFLSCVCAGSSKGKPFIGRSMVVDPWGTIVSAAAERETVLVTEINPEMIPKVREEFTPLKDRVLR